MTLIARPVAVWLCLLPFDYIQRETGFIAWVGLRGAVSILLAIMPILGKLDHAQTYFNVAFIVVLVSLLIQGWTIKPVARKLGLITPPRMGAVQKVEIDLPGAAHHELLSYRVVKDSPVLRGERIPRWAMPSLVVRDGKSMRYQYAGRLRENDLVYLFIAPSYSRLLDRLFASRAPVDPEDTDFFGAFAISPLRPAADLDAAYGPGLLNEQEKTLTIADLMKQRPAVWRTPRSPGSLILIVRDLDETDHIRSVGMSLEAVEPSMSFPIFINLHEIADRLRNRLRNRRNRLSKPIADPATEPVSNGSNTGENGA